ncbi:acyl-CoA thioesterase domain-containing protein [Sphingomonas jaspsi]|uniref:acyl-CoA thioesterase domain-containing protein n=1 Tax=Sphingomonas jaspsi TaxID=392409 RepID=UPI000685B1E2|nr:acyl-CoA thioesterase domain-containing protein [Sphingomonas jaspsi]
MSVHASLAPNLDVGSPFVELRGAFVATTRASGPWSPGHCHGGAVAALAVRAAAGVATRATMALARLTIDLLAPVPVGKPILPRIRVDKDGSKLQRLVVALDVDGRTMAIASLLRVRTTGCPPYRAKVDWVDETAAEIGTLGGFSGQFETVSEQGGIGMVGPGRVWFRMRAPLVEGGPYIAEEAAAAIADFTSAIGMSRPYQLYEFPSVDLSVGLSRAPLGEWIRIDAFNSDGDEGRAACYSTLSDCYGPFAHVVQTSFVERRS